MYHACGNRGSVSTARSAWRSASSSSPHSQRAYARFVSALAACSESSSMRSASGLVVLLQFGVGDALVHPRLLFGQRVVLCEAGGALERLGRLLEAVDAHVREADVDEFVHVDVGGGDGALVQQVGEHVGVHRVDLSGVDP